MKGKQKRPRKRKIEIKSRLEEIEKEREKHNASIKTCAPEKRRLHKGFEKIKAHRKTEVDKLLEENFVDGSEGKLLEKVLKAKIQEPKLHQISDNISKLEAQEEWHRSKLAELSKEEATLNKELKSINADEQAKICYDAYEVWKHEYFKTEKAYDNFRDQLIKTRYLNGKFYDECLVKHHGIKDDLFSLIETSHLKTVVINSTPMAALVDRLSYIYGIPENEFHDDAANPKRRLNSGHRMVDRRADRDRNTFETSYI